MDATERQALFAELERRQAALPQADGIEVDDLDVPVPLRRRELLLFAAYSLAATCALGVILYFTEYWLDGDQRTAPAPISPADFWDSLFSWETLVAFAVITITASIGTLLSPYFKPLASTRKAVAQRIAALVVETAPAQAPLRREGEFTVVLEDESGDQTLYHADESLARELHAGTAGLAVVAHHKLLAFQPLGA